MFGGKHMDRFVRGFMKFLRGCMFFFLGIFLISPLVGTLVEFIGLKWNFLPWGITLILSALCAFFMAKTTLFNIEGVKDLLTYGIIFVISGLIYMNYSPVLEVRQDPSVYMLKAMNLCNYGTTYSPMDNYEEMLEDGIVEELGDYADIENGTILKDGNLHTDFYPGGVYFYAMIGLLSKRMMFYGQTIIMMMNALLLYEVLSRLTKKKSNIANVAYTIAFIIAPIIVWFGRGSFSEPSAMLYVLLLTLLFIDKDNVPLGIFALTITSLYSARIDYILVMIVAIFALNYISTKWAVITTALGSVEVIIYSKVYWIYYDRITAIDMRILKYSVVLLILGLAISLLIKKFWKALPQFYRSYFMTVILVIIGVALALLAFRDNVATNYQMAEIHGRYIRTYAEDVMDMLFMVFPSIFIVGGLLGLFKIQRNENIDFVTGVFLLGITVAYSYFFISFGNSPQMYWGLRRYYNILLPVIFISFVLLTNEIESKTRLIIATSCLIISINMFYDSNQTVDYEGLDDSVITISDDLDNSNVKCVLYDTSLRDILSSVASYSDIEFIPVETKNIADISRWVEEKGYDGFVYMTTLELDFPSKEYNISYKKQGEEYNSVPTEVYNNSYNFYSYNVSDVVAIYEDVEAELYMTGKEVAQGIIYGDGWIGNSIVIDNLDISTNSDTLVIKRCGYDNYFFDNDMLDEFALKIIINDEEEIVDYEVDGDEILVNIENIDIINKLEINSSTVNLSEISDSLDGRELGLDIKMIYTLKEE
jgi:hypothetical protein